MTELVVALDVSTIHEEESLLEHLKNTVNLYKIGLRLFTAHGKRAVDLVHRWGGKVFLDLKFHDAPDTVAHAVQEAQRLGVAAVSLHLSGGTDMLKAAAEIQPRPLLWGVALLPHLAEKDLRVLSPRPTAATLSKNLARLGWVNGMDGIICPGRDVAALRKALPHLDMRFICPGIHPAAGPMDGQKKAMTPGEAAALGINHIVVGRPITQDPNPLKAAQNILAEMGHAAAGALERP